MDAVFVDGVPAKITFHDFRRHHLYSFPALAYAEYDNLIGDAIDAVYETFPGVAAMWDLHRDKQIWYEKTVLCYRLLTAWLITDQYPELSANASGGDVIRQKKIDGVAITFNTQPFKGDNLADYLRSNIFGRRALLMMRTAPRRALLRVERFV
jgi:hypothetical protein